MVASFKAEMLKTTRRPGAWILALIVLGLLLSQYFLTYLLEGSNTFLLPENMLVNVLFVVSSAGGPLALILGSLLMGSEYGWGTLKTVLTQKPTRVAMLLGKSLAIGTCLAVFVFVAFSIGSLSSLVLASFENMLVSWPPAGRALEALAAGWLILAAYAATGVFFAVLLKSRAAAVAIGLLYTLLLQTTLLGLPVQSEAYDAFRNSLLGKNATDLADSFGDGSAGFVAPGAESVEPVQAAIVLGMYVLAALFLAAVLLRMRDVA